MLNSKTAAAILAFAATSVAAQNGPWAQCGGQGWSGDSSCASGWECVEQNAWYSQCLRASGSGSGSSPAPAPETPSTPEPEAPVEEEEEEAEEPVEEETEEEVEEPVEEDAEEEVEEPVEEPATPPPASSGSCGAATVDQLVGYGDGTTGGGDGAGVTVSSCSEFEAAAEAGGVIRVSGELSDCGSIRLVGDTTLLGEGGNSGFVGTTIRLVDIENVVIRNLGFRNPPEGGDLIDIETSSYVWVDHCSFSNDGITGDKDFYDGLLDAKRASDYLTFSWNKFLDHWKGSLMGHSGSNGDQDSGTLHVTYHHNYWNNVNSRCPSIRFGTAHVYSSCYEDIPTSGINSREGAQVLVENNHFKNVRRAIVTDLDANDAGFAVERDNIFDDSDIDITQEGSLTVPYEYTLDPADCICEYLASAAGPGAITV